MKIYKITENIDIVQWVLPRVSEDRILKLLTFDCELKGNAYENINWYIHNPKKKRSNFYMGINGALIFDKVVYDSEIYTSLEMAGEILKIKMENGECLFVLNVMECINILDYNKTIWNYYDDGSRGRILEYAFYNEGVSESTLFKIPETSSVDIFTYSEAKHQNDEFYFLYKQFGFTGLNFEEIKTFPISDRS